MACRLSIFHGRTPRPSSGVPVRLRRHAGVFAEEAVEVGGVDEAQLEGNLLDRLAARGEQLLGVHDQEVVDEREGGASRGTLDGGTEVREGHSARRGVEGDGVLPGVVVQQQDDELAANLLVARQLPVPAWHIVVVQAQAGLQRQREQRGEHLAVVLDAADGGSAHQQTVGLLVEPCDARRQAERGVLEDGVEVVDDQLEVVRPCHELRRVADHVEMDVAADGLDLDEAARQQGDKGPRADGQVGQVHGGADLAPGAQDEEARLYLAREAGVVLEQCDGYFVGDDKVDGEVEFGEFVVGHGS